MSTHQLFTSRPGRSIRRSARHLVASCWSLALLSTTAQAIDFDCLYEDAPGTGFLNPEVGQVRREALEYAAAIWGRLIRPAYVGETITIRAQYENRPDLTLASASPHYFYSEFQSTSPAFVPNTNYPKALANHLSGGDLAPLRHEIDIWVDNGTNFDYGTAGTPPPGFFDFVSVAAHEIGHGLGFKSSIRESGGFGIMGNGTYVGIGSGELPTPYDRFLFSTVLGLALLESNDSGRENAVISGSVVWNGAAGIQGNGGVRPGINSPNPWDDGSSLSHVTDDASIMFASLLRREVRQTPSAIERGILRDMGWSISAVARTLSWRGINGPNASMPGNWGPATSETPLPGDALVFDQLLAESNVNIDQTLYSLGAISFLPGARAYTVRFNHVTETDFTGAGVTNTSAEAQTIILESQTATLDTPGPTAARMRFLGAATTGEVDYQLEGGTTAVETRPAPLGPYLIRSAGASIEFQRTAPPGPVDPPNADMTSFFVGGGEGNGGNNALLRFMGASQAGSATIVNQGGLVGASLPVNGFPAFQSGFGGQTRFEDNANARSADIRNEGAIGSRLGTGGYTAFADDAVAADAKIENLAGTDFQRGGFVEFTGRAKAERAKIRNHASPTENSGGRAVFFDDSSAGTASIVNAGAAAGLAGHSEATFRQRATADHAYITNEAAGLTRFFDDATAASATIRLISPDGVPHGGKVEFHDRATAASATFAVIPEAPAQHFGSIRFFGNSTAGDATLIVGSNARGFEMHFQDQFSGGTARFTVNDSSATGTALFFKGTATAGNAEIQLGRFGSLSIVDSATMGNATINLRPQSRLTASNGTLGNALIEIEGSGIPWVGGDDGGGELLIQSRGSGGDAVVSVRGGTVAGARGGRLSTSSGGNGGRARMTAEGGVAGAAGGTILFGGGGIAPDARVIAQAGGKVEVYGPPNFFGNTSIGSIEGAGSYTFFSGAHLITGGTHLSTTVSGSIGGSGALTKIGDGDLTLEGTNTFFGTATVDGGSLTVNGSLSGGATVNNGGVLKGNGSIAGKVSVNPGGIFAPGASPGTLTVGSLDLLAGGIIEFELGPARDLVVATGNISLAGGLRILLAPGYLPTVGDVIPLFQTSGQIAGAFASIEIPGVPAGLQFSPSSGNGTYSLAVTSGSAGFSTWIISSFTGGATVPADRQGPNDDPDQDGISNLVEYAIAGQDPTVANPAVGSLIAGTLSFAKRTGTSGLVYAMQASIDLGVADAWAEVPEGPTYINDTNTISFGLGASAPAAIFVRLSMTKDP